MHGRRWLDPLRYMKDRYDMYHVAVNYVSKRIVAGHKKTIVKNGGLQILVKSEAVPIQVFDGKLTEVPGFIFQVFGDPGTTFFHFFKGGSNINSINPLAVRCAVAVPG